MVLIQLKLLTKLNEMLNKCQQEQLPDNGKLSKFTGTNGWEIKLTSTCPSQEGRIALYII